MPDGTNHRAFYSGDVLLTRVFPTHSPATLAGLTVYPPASPARRVLCSSRRRQNKTPSRSRDMLGALFWRRPTLTRPIAVLPSALQRFTSVFGMGTGGATALGSPECGTALAVSLLSQRRTREAESLETLCD